MDAIEPFDYSDIKPFSTAYLPGFLADRYDEDDKKCAARVLTRMKNSTAAALHDTLGGYTGVQTLSEQLDPRTLEPPLRPAAGLDAPHPLEGAGLPLCDERSDRQAHR